MRIIEEDIERRVSDTRSIGSKPCSSSSSSCSSMLELGSNDLFISPSGSSDESSDGNSAKVVNVLSCYWY